MPKKSKDEALKDYISNNVIFSDIINFYLYNGESVVKESDLKELDTTFVNTNDEIFEKSRDLLKEVVIKYDNRNTYILVGIEKQTKMDKQMILRVLLYDSLIYRKQFKNKNKNDIIKPVITIVIYYGKKKWNAPKSIHDMFKNTDDNILKYIPNYHLNIIEPFFMSDEEIESLKSDFKVLCDFIRKSDNSDGIKYLLDRNYIISNETGRMINYITNSKLKLNEEEDKLDMCKGLDEFRQEALDEGLAKGKIETEKSNIKTMHKNGADINTIAKLLSLDINYVKEVLNS